MSYIPETRPAYNTDVHEEQMRREYFVSISSREIQHSQELTRAVITARIKIRTKGLLSVHQSDKLVHQLISWERTLNQIGIDNDTQCDLLHYLFLGSPLTSQDSTLCYLLQGGTASPIKYGTLGIPEEYLICHEVLRLLPEHCWGSAEKVWAWRSKVGGLVGIWSRAQTHLRTENVPPPGSL